MTGALLGPLDYMFGETLRVAVVVAIVVAVAVVVVAPFCGWSVERGARTWLFITSLTTIGLFTQHSPYRGTGRVLDLNPLGDLRVAAQTTGRFRDLVVANVALFVPLGVALAWRGTRFVRAAAAAAAVSVAVEVMQYIAAHGRVAQTTDVVTNVAGAIIGWAMFVALTGGWGPISRPQRESVAPPPPVRGRPETSSKETAA